MTETVVTEAAPAQPEARPVAKKAPKPETVDLTSAFCRNVDPELHVHCRGSGENGTGSTWFCVCDCHADVPVCRDCGQRGAAVTLTGTCVDVEGCLTEQRIRTANNSVHRTIREAVTHAESAAAVKALADKERRALERERTAREEGGAPRPERPVRAPRVRREPPTPQRCHCGCGGVTKGGRFVAGHDAKLKGMLVRAARRTPPVDGGRPATKAQAINSMAELIARDWPRKGIDAEIVRQADALFERHGPDQIVRAAVDARYGGREG